MPVESTSVQEYLDQMHEYTTIAAIQVLPPGKLDVTTHSLDHSESLAWPSGMLQAYVCSV